MSVMKKYATFSGRASRKEYWMYMLIYLVIVGGLGFLADMFKGNAFFSWFLTAIVVGTLLPSIAVGVRRLHDVNKSGAYIFLNFVPFVGWIYPLWLSCKKGDEGDNVYGPSPYAGVQAPSNE